MNMIDNALDCNIRILLIMCYQQCCGSGSGRIQKIWPDPDPKFKVHFGSFLDPGCIYKDVEQYSVIKFEH